jgi:hypothetical protein
MGDPGEMVTLVGLKAAEDPVGGTVELRVIVPVNPRSLVSVMVDVADVPRRIVREDGFDTIEKPGGGA